MALTFRHQFVNGHVDTADATLAQPSNWNADHVIAGGTKGALLVFDATQTIGINSVAAVASGQVLVSAGVTTLPAWSASPTLTSVNLSTTLIVGTNPAVAGIIRVPHGNGLGPVLMGRNAGNTADVDLIRWGYTTDTLEFGLSSNGAPTALFGSRIPIGGLTASFPALKRSAASLQVRLADDSAFTYIAALGLDLGGNGGLYPSSDGVFRLQDAAGTNFNRLQFGGTTASFPALKRNTTGIDVRLADDSGYGNITASGVFASAAFFGPGTYATAGDLRLQNNGSIAARNFGNTGDVNMLRLFTDDTVLVGSNANNVKLDTGASKDVIWGRPLVAVGATTLITLGKTGGSGPATAAQDSWMRVLDSTGAAFYVPAWK
jgi:hypothetical protein